MPEPGQTSPPDESNEARAGRCAIVGRPNVGKSTLLNALLGQKLVITTPTPGTTRTCVLGVYSQPEPPTQIAFVDTPGITQAKNALTRLVSDEARAGLADVDVVVLMTATGRGAPAAGVHPADEPVLAAVQEAGKPVLLALNKIDTLKDKSKLLPLLEAYEKRYKLDALVPISATKRTNLDALIAEIRQRLPQGLLYDADFLTDRSQRFFAAELVREAVIRHTREEIPHGVTVLIDEFSEEERLIRISATVVVEKASHKKIVIGAKGALLKEIGTEARRELEAFLGRKVFLQLWVKVIPGWTRDPNTARRLLTGIS